jgi:hypothetical protein
MDRDYLDDRRFPPDEGSGVLVINAPDEQQLTLLLERVDRALFGSPRAPGGNDGHDGPGARGDHVSADAISLPLAGRKLHVNSDWGRNDT